MNYIKCCIIYMLDFQNGWEIVRISWIKCDVCCSWLNWIHFSELTTLNGNFFCFSLCLFRDTTWHTFSWKAAFCIEIAMNGNEMPLSRLFIKWRVCYRRGESIEEEMHGFFCSWKIKICGGLWCILVSEELSLMVEDSTEE